MPSVSDYRPDPASGVMNWEFSDGSTRKLDLSTFNLELNKFLTKYRSQVAKAQVTNPIDSTPWFKPQTWATNKNYPRGTVVVSTDSVNCYIQKWSSNGVGGISAGSGSGPVGKQSAKVQDNTCVWEWVGTVRGQNNYSATTVQILSGTSALALLTNPITYSLTLAGITSGSNVVRFDGGIPADGGGGSVIMQGANGNTVASPSYGPSQTHSITFMTDANTVVLNDISALRIWNLTVDQLLIEVNDIALSDSLYGFSSTTNAAPTATSAPYPGAYIIDLSFLPQNSIKKVRIFSKHPWSQISVSSQYKVWKPVDPFELVITAEGDSSTDGGNASDLQFGTWFPRMARKLGFQGINSMAVGSTRFSTPGVKTTFLQRIDRLLQTNADIYCISTHNDESFSTDIQKAAFKEYFNNFLSKAPGKFLIVFGCIPLQNETEAANTGVGGNYYRCESNLRDVVSELKNPYLIYIPVVLDPEGQWVSGTGSAESPNGTGNSDWMWGLDPNGNQDGHPIWRHSIYMANRFANALNKTLNSQG